MKKTILLIIWTLICALMLVGGLELMVRKRLINPAFDMQGITYQMDNERLFRPRPRCRADIGRYGQRLTALGAKEIQKGAKTILMLGDSFTFGSNVDCEQTTAAYLEQALSNRYQVVNMGVVAYGPDQSYVQLQQDGLDLKPDVVVLSIFPANDFADIYKNDIFDVDAEGKLILTPKNSLAQQMPRFQTALLWDLVVSGRTSRPSRFIDIYRTFFYDNYDVELITQPASARSRHMTNVMRGVLGAYRDTLAAHDIALLVVVIPPIEPYLDAAFFAQHGIPEARYFVTEDLVETLCHEERIDCLNLHTLFAAEGDPGRLYDVEDQHLNPEGYRQSALQIKAWMDGK
ncbi:MAG: SGNH/GDSL hydrolase family protein [Lentisphaerae bacterium]|nr:SGNH/GDSL hydrolase family protein [Lentisphaerota bacterium]